MEFRGPRWLVRSVITAGTAATVASLVLLYLDAADRLQGWSEDLIIWTDTALCAIMLAEWFVLLWLVDRKWAFVRARWIDLIASLPLLLMLRPFRIIRLVRLLRLIRGIALVRKAIRPWQDALDTTFLKSVALVAAAIVVGSALAITDLERKNPALDNFDEALWWAIVTASTVGYGDRYPLTAGGQVVAALLMIVGIGLFGALAASLTQTFMPRKSDVSNQDILSRLDALEQRLTQLLKPRDPPPP